MSEFTTNPYDDILIPTYVLNLKKTNKLDQILNPFKMNPEFDVKIITENSEGSKEACLWKGIVTATKTAITEESDMFIVCNKEHRFSNKYSKEYLFENIVKANDQGATLLFGYIDNFGHAVPLTESRFWISSFLSTQFIVVYKKIFMDILNYKFNKLDIVDEVFSSLTSHKMVLYPFISRKKNLVNSDYLLTKTRLESIRNTYLKYIKKT
ncbi:glycosyl transferase [Pedobacter hiemivivus]|uniref:Glycosyl transferase n=1 Tax=Pedobacter hiemivivus TaxID=2530454 RepID=A0A4U1FZH3_9SPHI|nr:glycosyl transferase [Pedobacter hiemivivus]TKC56557.1 glycosyl transferase [Pedobacter hiemivivus]